MNAYARWAIGLLTLAALCLLLPVEVLAADPQPFSSSFEPDEAPLIDYCTALAANPLMQPIGRSGTVRSWNQAFFAAPFFTQTSYLHPIGSVSMDELEQPGRWLAIAFVAGESKQYRLDWVEAQSLINSDAGIRYNGRPAQAAFVTVSPCPGDFRTERSGGEDGFLKRGCRRSANMDTIRFRTDIASSTTSNCALVAGKAYYLNIGFFAPGETNPQAHTCLSGTRCEINMQPQ